MDNRVLFGVLTILFNNIGVPCFILGKAKAGILRIVLNFVTCGIVGIINFIKGIMLGIKILKMTDEEYAAQKDTLLDGIPKE
ncbi:MAG: hypothetical protein E7530_03680 [Ruminococcaceae bacterium]|nr:hypothetical protein [Oscillospiraceae bacterium]